MIIDHRFNPGDRISWSYHHFTGSAYIPITKYGHFLRYSGNLISIVHFDANRTPSRIPNHELSHA